MTKLWLLLGVSLALAYVIDRRDQQLIRTGVRQRDHLVTCLLTVILILFVGLRTAGNDTGTYLSGYLNQTPTLDTYTSEDRPEFADGIGFVYLNILLKTWGVSGQNYLMFYAAITVIAYMSFLRRYSVGMVWAVFMVFVTGFYTFSMAAIKQSLAIGICLCALPFALDGKWIRFFLLVSLGSMMHPYAVIYYLVPLMMFRPWTGRTVVYVVIFVAAGFTLESLLGTVLDITDMMGADYSREEMLGEGVNIFRVLVSLVPMGLAVLYGGKLFQDADRDACLMFNLAMLNGLIMFVGLFGTANYFARLANYFLPAQVVILPWILESAHPRDRRWLIPLAVVGYLGYFYYENAIIRPFDTNYPQMSLWDYLVDLLPRLMA